MLQPLITEPVYNPATEEILAHVPFSTKEDVDQGCP